MRWSRLTIGVVTVLLVMVAGAILPPSQAVRAQVAVLTTVNVSSFPESVAIDPVTNRIFVVNTGSGVGTGSVSVIDGRTHVLLGTISIPVGNPYAVAVYPTGRKAFVSNTGKGNADTINIDQGSFGALETDTVFVGQASRGMAVNNTTGLLYMAVPAFNHVRIVNADTYVSVATPTVTSPEQIAVNETTGKAYVTSTSSNNVSIIGAGPSYTVTTQNVGAPQQGVAVNPTTNMVYVTAPFANNIARWDEDNPGSIFVYPAEFTGAAPYGVVVNSITSKVYISRAATGQNSISVYDERADTFGPNITVGTVPAGVAINPNSGFVYVANRNSANVSVLGVPFLAESTVVSTNLGSGEEAVAVNPITNRVYMTVTADGKLFVLDGTTLQQVAGSPITVGNGPLGVAINLTTNRVYVTNQTDNSVSVIDGATNTVLGTIPTGAGTAPTGVTVNPTTNAIYVAQFGSGIDSVGVIAGGVGAFGTLGSPIATGSGSRPSNVTYNVVNNRVYVANRGDSTVRVIDASNNTVVGPPISIGQQPNSIAVNLSTNRIYVSKPLSDTVLVIDGNTNTVMGTEIFVGDLPSGVAVNSITNRVYAVNSAFSSGDSVSMIDGATSAVVGAPLSALACPTGVAINQYTNRMYVTTPCGSASGLLAVAPTYSSSATQTLPGTSVQVTFGSLFGASGADKIGLFPAGTPSNASPVSSVFTNGSGSGTGVTEGTVTLAIPGGQAAGNYEIRFVSGHTTQALGSLALRIMGAPVANADSFSVNNGSSLNVPAPGVLANDTDADTDKSLLQVQVVNTTPNGSLTLSPTGGFNYVPSSKFSGVDTFTYRVTDPDGLTSTATGSITVNAISCGPRPGVTISNKISDGALQSTITATATNAPGNALKELRFGTLANAVVTLNGQTISSNQTVTLPSSTTSVTLIVRRATPGLPTTVPFTAVDNCGSWPTFVGGGAGAGF